MLIFQLFCVGFDLFVDFRVPANLQDVCYCTAIREGTEAEWMFAYKRYEEIDSISEKNTLLDALGCTKIKWLLARYFY